MNQEKYAILQRVINRKSLVNMSIADSFRPVICHYWRFMQLSWHWFNGPPWSRKKRASPPRKASRLDFVQRKVSAGCIFTRDI